MLIGNVVYDPVFVVELLVPEADCAFYRMLGEVLKPGVGAVFQVENAVQVGNQVGTTSDITFNGLRRVHVGGIFMGSEEVQ